MDNDMEKDPDFLKYMAQLGLRDLYLNQSDELRQGLMKQQGATQDAWLQAGRAITKFALPPVFSLGVVGNLLSMLVLARCAPVAYTRAPPRAPHTAPRSGMHTHQPSRSRAGMACGGAARRSTCSCSRAWTSCRCWPACRCST